MNHPTGSETGTPQITIQPLNPLLDEPLLIRLRGFAPVQPVTVWARQAGEPGSCWQSHATFLTTVQGEVDLSRQVPLTGTYDRVDPMGLFWSLELVNIEGSERTAPPPSRFIPAPVRLEAEVAGTIVATAEVQQHFFAPGVSRTEVRHDGLVATLFQPPGPGPHPAVIVVGGSEGGLWELPGALLAAHGFGALVLAYFGLAPLPPELVEIPLEYFGAALRWLGRQEAVNPQAVAVMGWSRGGELALLLGATFPELRAVVAYVPSGVIWEGVQAVCSHYPEPRASWTLAGKPLPFVRLAAEAVDWGRAPVVETPGFLAALRNEGAVDVEQAIIPVERTHGPILLISGQDDQLWPSTTLAQIVLRRLTQHEFAFPVEHLSYPSAGHLIGIPYTATTVRHARHPVLGYDFSFGGTPAADAFARADSWPKVLAFLATHIGGQSGLSIRDT